MTPTICVLGAGAAGVCAALELASRGYHVKIFEKNTVFSGASGNNPGRMGHGFHYTDLNTAIMYLRESITLQRNYPHYLVGKDKPLDHPIRHGRYFITTDSIHPVKEVLDTYQKINEEYARLVAEDPANEVFGPPEKFYRLLDPKEYESEVNASIVAAGVETAEHLFDWKSFAEDRKLELLKHKNITLYEHSEVVRIERGEPNAGRFVLHIKNELETREYFYTDYIVNSTWEMIEALNDQVGIRMIPGARTNRLKCLLVVKLPKSLYDANSMFFCMGKHGMFSNMGNGFGMITYANVTNMENSHGLSLSPLTTRLLHGGATPEEIDAIAVEMLKGITHYIPGMAQAEIIDVKFGIVQTTGLLSMDDLTDPKSDVHKRDYYNVREEKQGLVSNPAVKLSNCVHNAVLVADLIEAQIKMVTFIKDCLMSLDKQIDHYNMDIPIDIKRTVVDYLDRYTPSKSPALLLNGPGLFSTMRHKSRVVRDIRQENQDVGHEELKAIRRFSSSTSESDLTGLDGFSECSDSSRYTTPYFVAASSLKSQVAPYLDAIKRVSSIQFFGENQQLTAEDSDSVDSKISDTTIVQKLQIPDEGETKNVSVTVQLSHEYEPLPKGCCTIS